MRLNVRAFNKFLALSILQKQGYRFVFGKLLIHGVSHNKVPDILHWIKFLLLDSKWCYWGFLSLFLLFNHLYISCWTFSRVLLRPYLHKYSSRYRYCKYQQNLSFMLPSYSVYLCCSRSVYWAVLDDFVC